MAGASQSAGHVQRFWKRTPRATTLKLMNMGSTLPPNQGFFNWSLFSSGYPFQVGLNGNLTKQQHLLLGSPSFYSYPSYPFKGLRSCHTLTARCFEVKGIPRSAWAVQRQSTIPFLGSMCSKGPNGVSLPEFMDLNHFFRRPL